MENNLAQITVANSDRNDFHIKIEGRLDQNTTASIWNKTIQIQSKYKPDKLTIDTTNLNYCDGAGIGLLSELKKHQLQAQKIFLIHGLDSRLQHLLDMTGTPTPAEPSEPQKHPIITKLGKFTYDLWQDTQESITFMGMLCYQMAIALAHPSTIRWKDFWKIIGDVGPNALGIIALIGFLVGTITAFQSAIALQRFGAEIYIITLAGIGLPREMAPLMVAILLAGRTASSFAAEIGTMKVNQEVDALTTLGMDPIRFLTIPRVLATVLMTPFLNAFMILFSLIGCAVVMHHLGYNFDIFIDQLKQAVRIQDFVTGMIKTLAFGVVIASVGCLQGLKTRFGASSVGYSTTRAVVNSLIMVVVVDGIFAAIYYALGI